MKIKYGFILFLFASVRAPAEWVSVFRPDFSGAFEGSGAHQFNFVGSAREGLYIAYTGVMEDRLRMITAHQVNSQVNHSLTRLTRHGNSTPNHALDIGRGAAMIRLEYRWRPNLWVPQERNVLGVQIGEAFRSGPYNPGRGRNQGDGPSFASVVLQALNEEGRFRFSLANGGGNSRSFSPVKDEEGFYTTQLAMAFNNTHEVLQITAPGGVPHDLQPRRFSIWADTVLVWNNHTHPRNVRDAEFQHISIGFGNGNDRGFEDAEGFGGMYEIGDVEVLRWRK